MNKKGQYNMVPQHHQGNKASPIFILGVLIFVANAVLGIYTSFKIPFGNGIAIGFILIGVVHTALMR